MPAPRTRAPIRVPRQTNAHGASVLYALAPRGVGTPAVESLTSYVRRLSVAHVLPPTELLTRFVLEPLRVRDGKRNWILQVSRAGEWLNGAGRGSEAVVRWLSALTHVDDIARTSFVDRRCAIDLDGWREERAWCPVCLADEDPYDRLAWAFRSSTVCVGHEVGLVTACANCARGHRALHPAANPSTCPACSASLAQVPQVAARVDFASQFVWDMVARLERGEAITTSALAFGINAAAREVGSVE